MTRKETKVLNTMRNLQAQGWHEEALLVDTAAHAIGGDDAAQRLAQRMFDRFFKTFAAN